MKRQILLNIIGNAIKFTDKGSVNVRSKMIFAEDGQKLAFFVQDTGEGIKPEQSRRLFAPFTQADSSSTRRAGGTGLGLALSRKLAQALGGDVNGLKILLVEDSVDNQELIKRILNLAGAEVEMASNGKEALDRIAGATYRLVLMDLQMPEMDGYETTKRLREKGLTFPIIALTAHAMKEERMKCLQNGFTDYLTKPVDREALIRTVAEYSA